MLANDFGSIYCHESSHIEIHEAGAPEFYTGAKLVLLKGHDYKIAASELDAALQNAGIGDTTRVLPFAVSVTQPTDYGTVYTLEELSAIAAVARRYGLRLHMDGARFANALAALGCSPADMTWRSGVDILSLGATKNGAINAEAVITFDDTLATELPYRMKRGGLVLSKARFVSAQIERYLADDLWLERARHTNDMARRLAASLRRIPGVVIDVPVHINMVFATLPEAAIHELERRGYLFYRVGREIRLVCRPDQSPELTSTNWSQTSPARCDQPEDSSATPEPALRGDCHCGGVASGSSAGPPPGPIVMPDDGAMTPGESTISRCSTK